MNIIFEEATKADIEELIELRIAYMIDDFGSVSDHERECMEKQLPDYFRRKLGTELVALVARDKGAGDEATRDKGAGDEVARDKSAGEGRIVSVVYLHIIESPASSLVLSGLYGVVLSVYTRPEYRGRGFCTKLMEMLVETGKQRGLARIDLSATNEGYPVYKKVGFVDKDSHYKAMTYRFS